MQYFLYVTTLCVTKLQRAILNNILLIPYYATMIFLKNSTSFLNTIFPCSEPFACDIIDRKETLTYEVHFHQVWYSSFKLCYR